MEISYKKVKTLECIAHDAKTQITENNYKINLLLAYEITKESITQHKMLDVHEKAKQWSAETCPDNLYFNHGQYNIGGIDNIIAELKEKPSSNRAIYSLIDQKTIINSGDKPIPSFMLFQSILDNNELYCNVYLRALEVSKFLRINLEEIRINIEKIANSSLNFSTVKLIVFACRAHHAPNYNPLEKPKLDLMSQYQIMSMLKNKPRELANHIRDMAGVNSAMTSQSFKHLQEIIDGEWSRQNKQLILSLLTEIISKIDTLVEIRKQHSHDERIRLINRDISHLLENLAGEIEK